MAPRDQHGNWFGPAPERARTVLSCGACRRQGKQFTVPHDDAGDRAMTAHWATDHPRGT